MNCKYNLRKRPGREEKARKTKKAKKSKEDVVYQPTDTKFDDDDYVQESCDEDENDSLSDDDCDTLDSEESSSSDEEYFTLERGPIAGLISQRIKNLIPECDFQDDELKDAVNAAMEKASADMVEEYCGVVPLDERWKSDLEESEIQTLEPELQSIRETLEKEQPSLVKILKARIPKAEKKEAVELFDILQNTEPYTYPHKNISSRIRKILDSERHLQDVNIEELEEEERKIVQHFSSSDTSLKTKILLLGVDAKVKARIYELYHDMLDLPDDSSERANLKKKIRWAISLPYQRMKLPDVGVDPETPHSVRVYCRKIYKKLDLRLYGMEPIKERLLQIVNNRIYNPHSKALVALKGPPGVGKTAVAKALAESLNLPFERISLGGMQDPSIFKGTDSSWVGSSPGILLQILKKMRYCNGIVLFDEIDKLGNSLKGKDIQYALLHVTDYIQNNEFQDLFLSEFPHDLSKIMFMFAMNDDEWLDSTLRDRLDILEVKKYSRDDVTHIIQRHLLPNALKDVGISEKDVNITTEACDSLQSHLSKEMEEGGLRPIEKELHKISSRLNMMRSFAGAKVKLVPMEYAPRNFKGFPYTLNRDAIDTLISKDVVGGNSGYADMYI